MFEETTLTQEEMTAFLTLAGSLGAERRESERLQNVIDRAFDVYLDDATDDKDSAMKMWDILGEGVSNDGEQQPPCS